MDCQPGRLELPFAFPVFVGMGEFKFIEPQFQFPEFFQPQLQQWTFNFSQEFWRGPIHLAQKILIGMTVSE